jgi:hypothetical protein
MLRSFSRCLGAAAMAVTLTAGTLITGGSATAQTNDWTLVTNVYECPPNFTGPGTIGDCGTTVAAIPFTLQVSAQGDPISFETDDTGAAMVDASGASLGSVVTIAMPDVYVSFYPVCVKNEDETIDMQINDDGIALSGVTEGDVVYCDWFLYGNGSTPIDAGSTPEATDASGGVEATPEADVIIEETTVPSEPVRGGRAVKLYTGDCDDLGEEVIWFNDILEESGEQVGDEAAIQAAASINWSAEFSLNDAIADGYALAVFENDNDDATLLACGELGGVDNQDGTLSIGLQQVDESGVIGTALFAYSSEDHTTADVIVVTSDTLLPTPTATT